MSDRKLCKICNYNLRAINYKTPDKIYYMTMCDPCMRVQKKGQTPRWVREGYKKRVKCEACGFVPKYQEQLTVLDYSNTFKTLCLNCEGAAKVTNRIEIKRGDLEPDF
jgi:hypothetical protein